MPDEKDAERSHRKKRRLGLQREKTDRKAIQFRAMNAESKKNSERLKLDERICHLHKQGYSKASVAKRLGVTLRRIDMAINASCEYGK
jgi:hypothetical protein